MNTATDTGTGTGSDTRVADMLAALMALSPPDAGVLDTLRRKQLSNAGLVDGLAATLRHLAHANAVQAWLLGEMHGRGQGDPYDSLQIEAGCAARWSSDTTQDRLAEAGALVRLFPETTPTPAFPTPTPPAYPTATITVSPPDEKTRTLTPET